MQFWQLFQQLLQQHNLIALIFFAIIGLIVGSFLNLVIHRLPLIITQQWRLGSAQFLTSQADIPSSFSTPIMDIVQQDSPLSLSKPASHCPHCQQPIKWYENIPLLSWIILQGKCSQCQTKISLRYPIIEIVTAGLSSLVVYQLGVHIETLFALLFVWTLITLAAIDFDTQLLPDKLTYPLTGLGLIVNSQHMFVSPSESIWGLIVGYFCLWIIAQLFYLIAKKQGMGHGDFKLLAALGAWLGLLMLPFIILLSSLLGSIIGLILMAIHKESRPFAFGPYLAISGIIALIFGAPLMQWYIGLY